MSKTQKVVLTILTIVVVAMVALFITACVKGVNPVEMVSGWFKPAQELLPDAEETGKALISAIM